MSNITIDDNKFTLDSLYGELICMGLVEFKIEYLKDNWSEIKRNYVFVFKKHDARIRVSGKMEGAKDLHVCFQEGLRKIKEVYS